MNNNQLKNLQGLCVSRDFRYHSVILAKTQSLQIGGADRLTPDSGEETYEKR